MFIKNLKKTINNLNHLISIYKIAVKPITQIGTSSCNCSLYGFELVWIIQKCNTFINSNFRVYTKTTQ